MDVRRSGKRRSNTSRTLVAIVATSALLALFLSPVPAPGPPQLAQGYVYWYDGVTPVSGATVWVNNSAQSLSYGPLVTDANGHYSATIERFVGDIVETEAIIGSHWGNNSVVATDDFSLFIDVNVSTVPAIALRANGIQFIQIPSNNVTVFPTANDMAVDIESKTDLHVLYISEYDGGWNDYLHRDSAGTLLTGIHDMTNYGLNYTESYLVSIMDPGGATDLSWDIIWDVGYVPSPKNVSMDAGWNCVGVSCDIYGNYDLPTDLVGGNNTNAVAWVGNAWADYTSPSWTDIQKQNAGGLGETHSNLWNAHGFLVKCSTPYVWNQSTPL